jgi:hypothetical protein
MKHHKMSFRADDPLFHGIKAMAEKRGMSISDYLRMMASLELLNQPPLVPQPVLMELKETLAGMDEYASRDPAEQVALLRRGLEAIETAEKANQEARKWFFALASGLAAYARAGGEGQKEHP